MAARQVIADCANWGSHTCSGPAFARWMYGANALIPGASQVVCQGTLDVVDDAPRHEPAELVFL